MKYRLMVTKSEKVMKEPKGLYKWLLTLPLDTIIGYTFSPIKCPIANYLLQMTGDQHAVAGATIGMMVETGPGLMSAYQFRTPEWAQTFIRFIDRIGFVGTGEERPVTVEACLSVMRSLLPPDEVKELQVPASPPTFGEIADELFQENAALWQQLAQL